MSERFSRLLRALPEAGSLKDKTVAVVGLGGVGGYCVEVLARSGVGQIVLVDGDTVDISNINRQIIATEQTVGQEKSEAWKNRVLSINPDCDVTAVSMFYLPEKKDEFFCRHYDFVIDAIDTVTAKIDIIVQSVALGIPVVSSMGFGNKLDPSKVRMSDISKTTTCPLARVMRRELRQRGITSLPVAFSDEEPLPCSAPAVNGKVPPASVAWVPSVAGIMIGGYVVKALLGVV